MQGLRILNVSARYTGCPESEQPPMWWFQILSGHGLALAGNPFLQTFSHHLAGALRCHKVLTAVNILQCPIRMRPHDTECSHGFDCTLHANTNVSAHVSFTIIQFVINMLYCLGYIEWWYTFPAWYATHFCYTYGSQLDIYCIPTFILNKYHLTCPEKCIRPQYHTHRRRTHSMRMPLRSQTRVSIGSAGGRAAGTSRCLLSYSIMP